jgi:hypothetical protein
MITNDARYTHERKTSIAMTKQHPTEEKFAPAHCTKIKGRIVKC